MPKFFPYLVSFLFWSVPDLLIYINVQSPFGTVNLYKKMCTSHVRMFAITKCVPIFTELQYLAWRSVLTPFDVLRRPVIEFLVSFWSNEKNLKFVRAAGLVSLLPKNTRWFEWDYIYFCCECERDGSMWLLNGQILRVLNICE